MFKPVCVIFLIVSSFAFGDDSQLPKEINPTDYLVFFNIRRALNDHRHVLEGELNSAAAEKSRAFDDLTRVKKVHQQAAISDEDLAKAQMVWDVASADFEEAQYHLDINRVESDLLEVRIAFSTGEPEDVRRLYPIYKRQWDLDCQIKGTQLSKAKAEAKFANIRAVMYRKLLPGKVVSMSSYQVVEVEAVRASNLQKAKQVVLEACDKDLPTLEELIKLQEHEEELHPTPVPPRRVLPVPPR